MQTIQAICRTATRVSPASSCMMINTSRAASIISKGQELPNEYQRTTSARKRNVLRWINLRKSLIYKYMTDDVNDLRYLTPFTILDIDSSGAKMDVRCAHPSDRYGGWRLSDDEVIGGNSRGDIILIDDDKQVQPFLRWSGNIDTSVPLSGKRVDRSGFCSIRSPSFTYFGSPKLPYNALEITCRVSDGRKYLVNLTLDSFLEDNIYQAILLQQSEGSSSDEFQTFVLPLRHFLQTYGGRIREHQMEIDHAISIQHIGFTLADGVDGQFCFDLAKIRAVNLYYGEVIE